MSGFSGSSSAPNLTLNISRRQSTLAAEVDAPSAYAQPKYLSKFKQFIAEKMTVKRNDPVVEQIIDKAATELYFSCSNHYDYLQLSESFGMKDVIGTWINLTILHIWMMLVRCHRSMNPVAYLQFRDTLIHCFYHDVDERLNTLGEEMKRRFKNRANKNIVNSLLIRSLVEYDEVKELEELHIDTILLEGVKSWKL